MPLVGGWVEKGIAARARHRAADTRIADKALVLRRTLAASFEDWPKGPQTLEELVKWAFKLASGFPVTEAALTDIVDHRADASRRVRRAVGAARDAYYAAANEVNPLIPAVINPVLKRQWEATGAAAAEGPLRRARAHVRRCLAELDSARVVTD